MLRYGLRLQYAEIADRLLSQISHYTEERVYSRTKKARVIALNRLRHMTQLPASFVK
jgi:hypothetical protein